jgi:hypothetical protein
LKRSTCRSTYSTVPGESVQGGSKSVARLYLARVGDLTSAPHPLGLCVQKIEDGANQGAWNRWRPSDAIGQFAEFFPEITTQVSNLCAPLGEFRPPFGELCLPLDKLCPALGVLLF